MDGVTGQAATKDREGSLQTYLRDHVAGAQHAAQLLEALRDLHAGTLLGASSAELLKQVEEDLAVLKRGAAGLGAEDFHMKDLAGWLGDKLSRLKLVPLGSPFSTFEALEFLSLGVLGKRALWRTLMSVRSAYPELASVDFATLIERAEAQYATVEKMRLDSAVLVFGQARTDQ